MKIRVGHGTDVHTLVPGRKLILGGVTIPSELGLLGHSDADALTHAIMDSLLGAMGESDIGHFFPPSESKWKDASSIEMLKIISDKLKERKATVINIDACIHLEAPKIGPYIPEMKNIIAAELGITDQEIGIKATTFEGIGSIGRREGIFVSVVCLLKFL